MLSEILGNRGNGKKESLPGTHKEFVDLCKIQRKQRIFYIGWGIPASKACIPPERESLPLGHCVGLDPNVRLSRCRYQHVDIQTALWTQRESRSTQGDAITLARQISCCLCQFRSHLAKRTCFLVEHGL